MSEVIVTTINIHPLLLLPVRHWAVCAALVVVTTAGLVHPPATNYIQLLPRNTPIYPAPHALHTQNLIHSNETTLNNIVCLYVHIFGHMSAYII